MKKVRYLFLTASALSIMFGLASCGDAPSTPQADFDFTVELNHKRTKVYLNEYKEHPETFDDHIVVHESNKAPGVTYNYTYRVKSGGSSEYVAVDSRGYITPKKLTDETMPTVKIQVYEATSDITRTISFQITNRNPAANAGANYSSSKEEKNTILGELESFAMNNFLTGITLFENGGWVRYSNRVKLGTETFVAGYGFGLLSEGSLNGTLPGITDSWPNYLRSATSSETYSINAWNAEGSQISDLNSYITSGFWGTRLDESRTSYEWYPALAKDTVVRYDLDATGDSTSTKTVQNNRPVPVDDKGNLITHKTKNEKGLYRRWRVYVKTSEVSYRTMANNGYDKRPVELEDYVFPFKMLLTQACGTFRGAELASDTSYGIKGGYTYFRNTKETTPSKADAEFNRVTNYDPETGVRKFGGELGISTGKSDELGNGEYIEFELINPIDDFTAMYTLSSSLYSPLPESFMVNLPENNNSWISAAKNYGEYGKKPQAEDDTNWFRRNMLCIGPFYLERWDTNSQIIFKQNDEWFEHTATVNPRYHIPGVHISIESKAQKDADHVWNLFNKGKLDSAGIPKSYLESKDHDPVPEAGKQDKKTRGDSTFKLNVNSCNQEMSDYLFGPEGKIEKHNPGRKVKPWMANNDFLRGLFWSIKRKDFAEARGVNPSYEYFADAYLTDIENPNYNPETDPVEDKYKSVSYNTTDEHKRALTSFLGFDPTSPAWRDTDDAKYGYSNGTAVQYFQTAVSELVKSGDIVLGTKSTPTEITIEVWWMYQSDIDEYGKDIKNYFEEAFNDNDVANSCVKLNVINDNVTDWQDVYKKHLMTGEFDLGFGAISGNTLNPLNFLEVLRSDNSSGFTLNWGCDTSKVSETYPIIYDGQEWSFDALWAAGDHGVIAQEGEEVKAVKHGYMKAPRDLDDPTKVLEGGDLSQGGILQIPFEFVEVENGVEFEITKIQVYLPGTDNLVLTKDDAELNIIKDGTGKVTFIEVSISKAIGEDINSRLFEANDLQDAYDRETDPEKKADIAKPFKMTKYNLYWAVEVYYDLKITGAMPVENVYYIAASESDVERSFARL